MKGMTPKRITALLIAILLVVLYVTTLVAAIFDPTKSGKLFGMCLFATVAVPLLAWIYIWMYERVKRTEGDTSRGLTTPPGPTPEEVLREIEKEEVTEETEAVEENE